MWNKRERRPARKPRARSRTEKVKQDGRTYRDLHRFKVQKPYCAPARTLIFQALEEYGVKIFGYQERTTLKSLGDAAKLMDIEMETNENLQYGAMAAIYLPMAIEATFCVPNQQAGWAEYLLERTGRLAVVAGKVDARNRSWAGRHAGIMPPHGDRPWIESSCSDGVSKWKSITERTKKKRKN